VTFQQVQKYEKGSNRIPVDRLISLSKYLDVPLERFFTFTELSTMAKTGFKVSSRASIVRTRGFFLCGTRLRTPNSARPSLTC